MAGNESFFARLLFFLLKYFLQAPERAAEKEWNIIPQEQIVSMPRPVNACLENRRGHIDNFAVISHFPFLCLCSKMQAQKTDTNRIDHTDFLFKFLSN